MFAWILLKRAALCGNNFKKVNLKRIARKNNWKLDQSKSIIDPPLIIVVTLCHN